MNKINIQEIINKSVRGKRRKHHEQKTWYVSSLGSCLTANYLARKGIATKEFDDRTLRVFKVGNMFEDWLVEQVAEGEKDFETQIGMGGKVVNGELIKSKKEDSEISGYADLRIGNMIYEIKTKHSKAFWYMNKRHMGPNRQHEYQLWTYLKLLNKPEGRLVYLSKDDLAILEYPVFLKDKELESEVMNEINILNEAWEKGLPPKPVEDKKDWRYKYCSNHKKHCLKQSKYLKVGGDNKNKK